MLETFSISLGHLVVVVRAIRAILVGAIEIRSIVEVADASGSCSLCGSSANYGNHCVRDASNDDGENGALWNGRAWVLQLPRKLNVNI